MVGSEEPRAPPAQAEAGYQHAPRVHRLLAHHLRDERQHGPLGERVGPGLGRTVRGDDDRAQAIERGSNEQRCVSLAVVRIRSPPECNATTSGRGFAADNSFGSEMA